MILDVHSNLFKLSPLEHSYEFFPDHVHLYLKDYISFLSSLKTVNYKDLQAIEAFDRNILLCLEDYYFGQHEPAKQYFNEAIDSIHVSEAFSQLNETVFYRARLLENSSGKRFSKEEMFHIPFEKRYLVSTQRYSYPGLPCLYLGSSVDVCCLELDSKIDAITIATIERSPEDIYNILDLGFYETYDFSDLPEEEFSRFVRLWPLVACCSFSFLNTSNMKFRPDYILPQMLLEYIIDCNATADLGKTGRYVQGIKYLSVKKFSGRDSLLSADDSQYYNYVFPVRSLGKTGFCKELSSTFSVKRVDCFS